MKMRLIPDWKKLLFGSWSARFGILASLAGAAELLLPLFQDLIPRGPFAGLSMALAVAVPVARIMAQPSLHEEEACDGDTAKA